MITLNKEGLFGLPEIKKKDGIIHHVICEGNRKHVIMWDSFGRKCSHPECEINKERKNHDSKK